MASIKTVLRKKLLTDGTYPICLRVTINRKSKFFTTPFTSSKNEWNGSSGQFKNNKKYLQQNRVLLKFKDRAFTIYSNLELENENFSLIDFEKAFRKTGTRKSNNVFSFWDELIEEQNTAGRTGNARIHGEAYHALKRFHRSQKLEFSEVNLTFLTKFENYLRSCGGTDGGISIRMRSLRALFNTAIKRELISADIYPFKKYQISKLKSSPAKKALDFTDVMKIVKMDISKYPHLLQSHKYFVFSFYTRGMNFADQMLLEWKQINGDKIFYTRSKSKGNFNITILPPVQNILEYFKKNSIGTKYVFPILLRDNMTPIQIEYRKHKTLRKYNQDLKEITKLCEINKHITSYVARHSYANCLKQKGVATDIISESLGHQNLAVTQAYLKELDSSVLDEASALLL